jgi:hypothetical protein
MINFPTNFGSNLSASLGDQLADTGLLAVIIFAAAIPLTFYVIKRLIGLIPHEKKDETKAAPRRSKRYHTGIIQAGEARQKLGWTRYEHEFEQ